MGNFQVRNVNDLETGEWTQEVLQMDKCQHRTSDNLLPEDSFTSFVLPDLALTRKSSRSPRPDTASNLVMKPRVQNANINNGQRVTWVSPSPCKSQQDPADELYLRVSPRIFPA